MTYHAFCHEGDTMNYGWHDVIGNLGVLLILATYLLLQIGRMSAESLLYSAANGAGAVLILISLLFNFNLSAFIMEAAWLVISVYGIRRYYARGTTPANS